MAKKSKRFKKALEEYKREQFYSAEEAVKLVKKLAAVKFDAAVELHFKLKIDPKQSDQIVRTSMVLPHGTGKKLKIAVFAEEEKAQEAKAAGAVIVGGEDLIKEIKSKQKTNFDIALASPTMMKKLASIAKILGQRGLMPNPKAGTITTDFKKTIKELQGGKILIRNDEGGNLHQLIGKISWPEDKLVENLKAYVETLRRNKPSGIKGIFIEKITLCSTMSPGIKVKV